MKIVTVFLRYGYGIKSLGDSLEYVAFYSALKQITDEVYPFWYDEYLNKKEELQKRVIKFIDDIRPDIVFFTLMEDEFSFKTFDYLRSKYITINWFWDDQWRFENFTKYYAPHFTYCITTDKFALAKYGKVDYKNAILSSPASFGYAENLDFEKIEYKYDVSFVGGAYGYRSYRKWLVAQLEKRGIHVECFGQGWENGVISFDKLGDIFKSSKVNLNISNSISYDIRYIFSSLRSIKSYIKRNIKKYIGLESSTKNMEQIKARHFEIPAFGGFQLTNYVPSLEDYFEIGKEVAIYTFLDDLLLSIKYYLDNEEERKKIMINAYKKVIDKPTYLYRFKDIFKKIKML